VPARAALSKPGQPTIESPRKMHRVEEIVVEPAIDDIDPASPAVVRIVPDCRRTRGSRPSTSSTPMSPSEQGMLGIGPSCKIRSEHHHGRSVTPPGAAGRSPRAAFPG